ncbi:MAG: hypothetical protein OXU23_11745 [Candidatus Poribacteria bacterium]|nr:hypothetical protein [Candidatus Poribacteria bacterium]
MEQQNQAILTRELSQPIAACVFSKDDLKNLCEVLQEWCSKASDEEIKHHSPLNRTPEQFQADIAALRSGFELKVTVQGIDEERIYGTIPDVFNSPRFPDQVKTLYINSESDLRNLYNWFPRNRFELLLDFAKPELFNLSLSPSISTPNSSNILVSGLDSTWVSGIYGEIANFIEKNRTRRKFFHRHSVYDLLLLFFGIPFAFWVAYKLSGLINSIFGGFSVFVQNGVYVCLFFLMLHLFKILFDYARWVFPIVEYKSTTDTARKHRYILGGLIIAIFGNFFYDLIKIAATLIS